MILAKRVEKGQQQQLRENMWGFQKCLLNSHLGLIAVMLVSNEDMK